MLLLPLDSSTLTTINGLRVPVVLLIALIYAAYDIFNKRDIPDKVAYASLVVGVLFTLALDTQTIIMSALIALVVGALSYALYRVGQMGLGDGFEFVALSLIIPIQPAPWFVFVNQLGLPFILSIFIATGFAAVILVPIYYISKMKRADFGKVRKGITQKMALKAVMMLLAYGALFLFITYSFGFSYVALAIIALIALPSIVVILFEKQMMLQMIEKIYPSSLEEGDIIAMDLMTPKEVAYFKAKYTKFGKLADKKLIERIAGIKRKMPVYKKAIPLALPTLIGTLIAFALGNLLLLVI
ncbi:MAG: prepilin peptidase [Candidatus Micrarchaeota archaeon]|nr:prepilin peptidase [Candidatus Micrarchaeota archaeon]